MCQEGLSPVYSHGATFTLRPADLWQRQMSLKGHPRVWSPLAGAEVCGAEHSAPQARRASLQFMLLPPVLQRGRPSPWSAGRDPESSPDSSCLRACCHRRCKPAADAVTGSPWAHQLLLPPLAAHGSQHSVCWCCCSWRLPSWGCSPMTRNSQSWTIPSGGILLLCFG